ncbi:MAG: carbohydrate binding family 9 domain-containing protein [Ignavibacteriales bacterium]|nr:carbohydrate binding family 9 domain-containing protein [Ignavibacteriales bacterium]
MNIKYSILVLLTALALTPVTLFCKPSEIDEKPIFNITKIAEPIKITGKMDNPLWLTADEVELNYEVTPGDNTPAPQKTLVKAMYDENYLYFGFKCLDSNPEQIRANISDRDRMYQDDWVFVAIDTYGDFQRSYELCVNPYGIQGDLLATINGEDASIDWIWHSAASKNETGWTAELAIPFSSLSFPDADEQNWRINILRTVPRGSRTRISWVKMDRNIPGIMTQAGHLKGLKNIKSGNSIELLPYAMGQMGGGLIDFEDPSSGFKYAPMVGRIGGGIKYSPSPDFSIDAVINPDFSQIESDAAQISVNTTFALQYEEKRPYFLIGRELLQTPMYYSRSINDPKGAARLIGKAGSLSYMYMGAYDRNTVFVIPGEERSNTVASTLGSYVNIGRLRYDLGDESYIGSMVMTRNLSEGHNYIAGLDWNYKFWSNWYFSGEGFLSQTKELNDSTLLNSKRKFGKTSYNAAFNGEKYSGNGIHLVLSHNERSYNFNFVSNHFSPTYQTYNGLFDQNGYRAYYMSHEYTLYPESLFIDRGTFGFNSNIRSDFYGVKKEQVIQPFISMTLKGQTNLYLQYLLVNDENFRNVWFKRINRFFFNINTRPLNEISLSAYGNFGKFIYRTSSPTMGKGQNIGASITLKPTSQLNVSFSYDWSALSSWETGEKYYDGFIYRGVGTYQFSPELFVRAIFQYDDFGKSFQFYPLFSYKLNAFTTFYAGATSDYMRYEGEVRPVNTSQQYFMKLQYLLTI